jgi:hypothetical protein
MDSPLDKFQFLTRSEVELVDQALMTSQDKFATRIALYALRCLKEIADQTGNNIENITTEQVVLWIESDENLQKQLEIDASFISFFSQLVMASLRRLHQIAEADNVNIQDLSVSQVVAWFEGEAKRNLIIEN